MEKREERKEISLDDNKAFDKPASWKLFGLVLPFQAYLLVPALSQDIVEMEAKEKSKILMMFLFKMLMFFHHIFFH